jgi:hypothetical protein
MKSIFYNIIFTYSKHIINKHTSLCLFNNNFIYNKTVDNNKNIIFKNGREHAPGYEEWVEIMRQGEYITSSYKTKHAPGYEEWVEIMRQSE